MRKVVRITDHSDHGGVVITGSNNVFANGLRVARLGDLHSCPIAGHGITPIISGSPDTDVNQNRCARVGDVTGCGAVLIEGSPDVFCN